ncbi:hypothetical protein [Actinacidiphila glaucinigra]|uniref:Uncharacterized protein n=1 Tax=Actinacidiphila glaucinigra TaxID=235986 RepID=A0A239N7A0_9ACTN|nr:hypothetical protein [Actinacidiphila glaucinigra]SNT50353.1 hypothetical protein SAMN05216252_1324 [Actinacidiphila glaucinigra]
MNSVNGFFDPPEPHRVPPGKYPLWDEALALVNRDLAATLPDRKPLRLQGVPSYDEDEDEYVCVALANGEWHGNFMDPDSAYDPALALEAVTDAAQETVAECLWQAWPVCGEHKFGMHAREADGRLSWWCAGNGLPGGPAHIRAAVGGLDGLPHPYRPERKRRRAG